MSKKLLAVVTGATSGIGAALAHALAARGMDLIVIARRNERLEAIKAHLNGLDGITVRTICAWARWNSRDSRWRAPSRRARSCCISAHSPCLFATPTPSHSYARNL